jgi:hypothetical protein
MTHSVIKPINCGHHMAKANVAFESRVDRRKRRNRLAHIEAANKIMTEKGIDAAGNC